MDSLEKLSVCILDKNFSGLMAVAAESEEEVDDNAHVSQKKKKLITGIDSQIDKLKQKSSEIKELRESEEMGELGEIMQIVADNLDDDLVRSVEMKKMVLRSQL